MKANTKQPGLVLIIDAESATRRERKDVLEWAGLRVEEAADAREGLSLARLLRPELIFCARQVGEVAGEELLRLLDEEWENGGAWAFVLIGDVDAVQEEFSALCPGRDPDEIVPETISGVVLAQIAREHLSRVEEWRAAEQRAEEQVNEVLNDWEGSDPTPGRTSLEWDEPMTSTGRVHSQQIYEVARETVLRLGRSPDLECFIDNGFLPFRMEVLRSVVEELIGNACRFTSKGTRIDLFFIRGAERSVLFIRDYGHGMEAAMAVRLTAGWDSHGTTGRGLLTVRRLVREAGASFRVDGGIDEGVTVRIEIPDEEGRATLPMTIPEDMGIPHLRIGLPRKQGKR